MKKGFLLVLSMVIILSCKKESDLSIQGTTLTNDPVFKVQFTVNSVPNTYTAGNSSYYMYSDYYNSNGIWVMDSHLKTSGSSANSPNSIQILLSSYNYDTIPANFNPDSLFYVNYTFTYSNDTLITPNALNTSEVIIRYFDDQGIQHSSNFSPGNNFFTITSVEDYPNNENNQKVKRIGYSFDCSVATNTSGNGSKTLAGDGFFAFAIPN